MARKTRTVRPEAALEDPSGCLCAHLRRTARAVTQVYDEALGPLGLTVSQFCVLSALVGDKGLTMQELAAELGMDRTTLTRALAPLTRDKLLKTTHGEDRRKKYIVLTTTGIARHAAARPAWLKAQKKITKAFGEGRSSGLLSDLDDVVKVTSEG